MKCSYGFQNKKSFAAVVLVFLLVVTACDGATSVDGNITDEDGNPVADAIVVLEADGIKDEHKSSAAGFYQVGATHSPFKVKIKLAVSKTGYETYVQEFDSKEKLGRRRDIILIKAEN
ncbi:MAG TPA: carboxypeptidase-like regulatory domain-containing protein [Pyrinomonadaceae bacterium]|jgi:type III secretory pathway lipoprotein EscJ